MTPNNKNMRLKTITEREDLVIRRMILEPGERMCWHTDACHRFSVVVRGSKLGIQYRDSNETIEFDVYPGTADWDAPDDRVHRAINTGTDAYEEIVTFYRADSSVVEE